MLISKVHVEAVILSPRALTLGVNSAKDLGEILRSAQYDDLIHMHFADKH